MQSEQQREQAKGGDATKPIAGMQTIFQMRLKDGTIVRLDASGEVDSRHANAIKGLVDMALGADPQKP
jgi:hypothetical protein